MSYALLAALVAVIVLLIGACIVIQRELYRTRKVMRKVGRTLEELERKLEEVVHDQRMAEKMLDAYRDLLEQRSEQDDDSLLCFICQGELEITDHHCPFCSTGNRSFSELEFKRQHGVSSADYQLSRCLKHHAQLEQENLELTREERFNFCNICGVELTVTQAEAEAEAEDDEE